MKLQQGTPMRTIPTLKQNFNGCEDIKNQNNCPRLQDLRISKIKITVHDYKMHLFQLPCSGQASELKTF
jgi:hypothetical protein